MPLPTGRIPKNLLQGFCMDLITELSKEANFDFEIYLHKSYAGMVEELKKKVTLLAHFVGVYNTCN